MATPIFIPAQSLHECALQCVKEIDDRADKIFAVASGGVAYAGLSENATEEAIFLAIKDLNESTFVTQALRDYINQLAAHAGSKPATKEVSHG